MNHKRDAAKGHTVGRVIPNSDFQSRDKRQVFTTLALKSRDKGQPKSVISNSGTKNNKMGKF